MQRLIPRASIQQRCSNIRAENVTVTVPSGKTPVWECKNIDKSLLKINCAGGTGDERDTTNG